MTTTIKNAELLGGCPIDELVFEEREDGTINNVFVFSREILDETHSYNESIVAVYDTETLIEKYGRDTVLSEFSKKSFTDKYYHWYGRIKKVNGKTVCELIM